MSLLTLRLPFLILFLLIAAGLLSGWLWIAQPTLRRTEKSMARADPAALRAHVEKLSVDFIPRDWTHTENLNRCADYITQFLREHGGSVENQSFRASGRTYRNVSARFGPAEGRRIIVGAHYDAFEKFPGADDNASGVAALLELGRLLGELKNPPAVELVAYPLEEPPFITTDDMGSAVHADRVARENIRGVLILEMVGYFSDEPGSQSYPVPLLHLFYPGRGNFIALAGRGDQGPWIREVKRHMKGATPLPVHSIRAPAALPGIDFSDHRNYWPHGIPALMVTDTAFYRNTAYHTPQDTADRLDYDRMAQTTIAVFEALRGLQK